MRGTRTSLQSLGDLGMRELGDISGTMRTGKFSPISSLLSATTSPMRSSNLFKQNSSLQVMPFVTTQSNSIRARAGSSTPTKPKKSRQLLLNSTRLLLRQTLSQSSHWEAETYSLLRSCLRLAPAGTRMYWYHWLVVKRQKGNL